MKKKLSSQQIAELLTTLKERFEENSARHKGIKWDDVRKKLEAGADKLWSLAEMERTGGEPDVVGFDKRSGEYVFFDCADETPAGRRSLCYDRAAWDARKQHKPESDAVTVAAAMGIEMLTEEQYRELQEIGEFDLKTSSWVKTPDEVRTLGGALFCDRRYNRVFTFHNGADSYYAARGFRGMVRV